MFFSYDNGECSECFLIFLKILKSFNTVVLSFDDSDNSACDGIRKAREQYPDAELIFANGGDRTKENIPEEPACQECNVSLEFGVGGENKANSSSWILANWKDKK